MHGVVRIDFAKMHSLGNDFVVIDGVREPFAAGPDLLRRIADRHTGVGCDQILVAERPSVADVDFRFRIFNADGGEVGQCGNGARCLARFLRARGLTDRDAIRVETLNGRMTLKVDGDDRVTVDMGEPILEPAAIPFEAPRQQPSYELETSLGTVSASVLSMGNPHAVLFVDSVAEAPVDLLGAEIERHRRFPQRANVGFLQVLRRDRMLLRVFERGVGETRACGSGACAALVAARLRGLADGEATVVLPGGELVVRWPGPGHAVELSGPACHVFDGCLEVDER